MESHWCLVKDYWLLFQFGFLLMVLGSNLLDRIILCLGLPHMSNKLFFVPLTGVLKTLISILIKWLSDFYFTFRGFNYFGLRGSDPCIDLFACFAAGGTSIFCTYPLDLARTQLAYQVVIWFKAICSTWFG